MKLHRFLKMFYDLNKDPLCADEDLHFCNDLCDNDYEKTKFLLPIMEEIKKGEISHEKKKIFLHFKLQNSLSLLNNCLEFNSVILVIVGSREI